MGNIASSMAFPHVNCTYNKNSTYLTFVDRTDYSYSIVESYKIPVRHLHINDNLPTLLMCHGNAEDIGHASIDYLASQLSANICLFDYAGYGLHTCKVPSEANCQKDVVAVYEYLIQTKKIHPEKIVIYGRSLGSGPACYLAYHLRDQYLRPQKLILVSPLRSGASIFTHSCIATPVDIFMNYRLAPYIQSSVLILHGDRDEVVPYECGEDLATRFPNLHRFHTLNGYSHNDIQSSSYYDEIKQFLRSPIKL